MAGPGIFHTGRKHTLPAGPLPRRWRPPLPQRPLLGVDMPAQPPTKNAATMITIAACFIFSSSLAQPPPGKP